MVSPVRNAVIHLSGRVAKVAGFYRPWICACMTLVMMSVVPGTPASAETSFEAVAYYGEADDHHDLLVRSTTDIEAVAEVMKAFARQNPQWSIRYEQWSSNALYRLADAECRIAMGVAQEGAPKDNAEPSDLLISSAIDQQVKLVNDGCASVHTSEWTRRLPNSGNWRNELFGVTREPAVMVYNRRLVTPADVPASRFDLLDLLRFSDSRYTGRVATYDIERSGLGYLFAFADSQQASTFGALLEALGRADVQLSCCSSDIIDKVAEGEYLLAYNILGSYALARAARDSRLAVVAPSDYTLVLSRAAMIPRYAQAPVAARALVDFLLSDAGQHILASSWLVVPMADEEAAESTLLEQAESAPRAIALSPSLLVGLDQHKRALFIDAWRAKIR